MNLWPHQVEALKRMHGLPAGYLSMEQRTGKSAVVLQEAAELYLAGKIDALLIIAMPSGAPRNWVDDEIPQWLPPTTNPLSFIWRASKINTKVAQETLAALLAHTGLSILAVNGEAIITEAFKKYAGKFLRKRRTYTVADESTLLQKTPGAKRTRTMHAIAKLSLIRRCLDGTPTGEGPMDLYSQYRFLDPNILNFDSFFAFRNRYAVLEQAFNHTTAQAYTTIKKTDEGEPIYQNLDELQAKIAPYTYRVLFKDVFANVPEPIYQKHYFPLHPEQRRVYDALKEEYEVELQHLGTVTVAHVLTRLLRLQQIASGYFPAQKNQPTICPACLGDGCPACQDLGCTLTTTPLLRIVPQAENPRIKALQDELTMSKGPCIVWARFDQDIDDALEASRQLGRRPVRYDGRDNEEQKAAAKAAFQGGQADDFIAKTRAAGRAVRLDKAETHIFYSNEFGLLQRLQAEMRTQTGSRTIATGICDLVAEDTLDSDMLIPALRSKKRIADMINQDKTGRWL